MSFFGTYREKNNLAWNFDPSFYVAGASSVDPATGLVVGNPYNGWVRLWGYSRRSRWLHDETNGGIPRRASALHLTPKATASGRSVAATEFSSSTRMATSPTPNLWNMKAKHSDHEHSQPLSAQLRRSIGV